jgi:hypothetical protein
MGCAAIAVRADIGKNIEQTRLMPRRVSPRARTDRSGIAARERAEESFARNSRRSEQLARAIVVGHTVAPTARFARGSAAVYQIDTGMLDGNFYTGGKPSALEIKGDAITAIYTDRREPLGTLPAPNRPRL